LKFKNEAQVEAIFLDACVAEDAKHQAYEVIAASGENASTLHYIKNDEPLEGRQFMCLDAGCEWECYASDVTRTFPISGAWPSKEAKEIYDLVQNMQTTCISRLAPGARFLDLHVLAHQIAIQGLMSLGILHNGDPEEIYRAGTSRAFFPHGLGHHLGLEVHDVGQKSLMAVTSDNESDPTAPEVSTCKQESLKRKALLFHSRNQNILQTITFQYTTVRCAGLPWTPKAVAWRKVWSLLLSPECKSPIHWLVSSY
jgi:Xaa-Pro aminopeptidase